MEYIENVQGKNITITNSNGDNANSVMLLGDVEQTSYSGKNLLKIPTSVSRTFNGITYTVNDDGSVTVKGTVTQAGGFYVDLDTPIELDGVYTFSLKCVGTTNASGNQQWLLRQSDNTTVYSPTIISNNISYNSGEKHTTISKLQIFTAANATIDMTVYPQLELKSTYTEWEPYVGGTSSPNPDYPQEVKTVKGVENIFNKDNADIINGFLADGGTLNSNDNWRTTYLAVQPNTTYTISKKIGRAFRVAQYQNIPEIGSTWTNRAVDNNGTAIKYTTTDNGNYLVITYYNADLDVYTDEQMLDSIMVEKSDSVHDYVPYGKLMKVRSAGKNLFNKDTVTDGIFIATSDGHFFFQPGWSESEYIKVSDGNYTLSSSYTASNNSFEISQYDDFQKWIKSEQVSMTSGYITYQLESNTKYIRIGYRNDRVDASSIQYEKGSTSTNYEPYQYKEYPLNTGDIELCKIGDYQDSFIKGIGKNLINPNNISSPNNGITSVYNQDQSIHYYGTATKTWAYVTEKADISLPAGTYTFSRNKALSYITSIRLYYADDTHSDLNIQNNNTSRTATYTNDIVAYQIIASNYTVGTVLDETIYIQLEESSVATEYEPYGAKDKWLLHKEIGKYNIDSSTVKSTTINSGTYMIYGTGVLTDAPSINDTANVICSHLSGRLIWQSVNEGIYTNKNNLYFTLKGERFGSTASGLNTYLDNLGMYVYYPLVIPTNILITDTNLIKQLNTLDSMELTYGTVNIDSCGDLPAFLDINYNNWNKDINPSDRVALLDGTATIETEIEITGNNLLDVHYSKISSAFYDSNGVLNSSTSNLLFDYIIAEADKEYTLKTNKNMLGLVINEFNNNKQWIKRTQVRDTNINTITTTANTAYIRVSFNKNNATTMTREIVEDHNPILTNEGFITVNQNNSVISWNHEDFRYVKDEGFIGQFVARQLTGELKDLDDDFNITDKELHLKLGVRTNNNTNWYSLGNFLTTKITNDEVKDKTSFESLDYTKKFNKKYDDTITYPCTARDLALNVCEQCGVELATPIFKNHDYVIDGNVFKNNETCRDVMKAIGKLAFSWVRVDWDDKVYLDFTKEIVQRNYDSADNSQYYNLKTQKEKFGPVNRIVIGYSQIDGERTFIDDVESISENGECELTVYDNPLVYNAEQRAMIIESARELMGLEYTPLNTLTIGHPWLKGKELFNVVDMEGNSHKTIPFDRTIQYFGHIKTLIDVNTATKTENSLAYKPDIEKGLMETEIQVNKNTGDITSLTRRTENVEDGLDNTYTIEQTNQLIQNASTGITNTFSEAGGNNIFRNTGLWFEQSDSVTKTGKNLFNSTDGENGWINSEGIITAANENYCSDYIPLKTGVTYTISMNVTDLTQTNIGISIFDSEKTYVSRVNNRYINSVTFTAENDGYIRFWVQVSATTGLNATNVANTYNVQLEKGSTPTSYEPYYEYTNDYEFWDGPVVKQKEESAANLNALLLQLGTLSQEQLVPNGNYTISFKYKKLINLANVKCVINDIEYQLTETNETEFMQVIEVSSQHINVKFKTNIDNSCEIYDLMVNAGSVKLAYSQNQNETTTDTVNISKGITITSSDTDTTFKANADGIRTLDKNGNVKTRFTDTGMTTKEQIVEEKAEIVGVLIQQVGDQTWFTRL